MKRIIDIPEEEYGLIDEWGTRPYLLKLIKNSTPLNECDNELAKIKNILSDKSLFADEVIEKITEVVYEANH